MPVSGIAMTSMASGLAALERQVARERDLLAYPAAPWVAPMTGPDGTPVLDCAVIGAGQFGLAVGGFLKRKRVANFRIFDAAAPGRESPWVTFGRMAILRTPKDLSGPELGLPSLSFRAFWEAQHGAEGWARMYRVPRSAWMDYLNWFHRVIDLPISNGWRLTTLTPVAEGRLLRLVFATPAGEVVQQAKSVLLATGAAGGDGYALPTLLRAGLGHHRLRAELHPLHRAAAGRRTAGGFALHGAARGVLRRLPLGHCRCVHRRAGPDRRPDDLPAIRGKPLGGDPAVGAPTKPGLAGLHPVVAGAAPPYGSVRQD